MRAPADCRVYGIVDLSYVNPGSVPAMTTALAEGGADIIQLRAKKYNPREIEPLARLMSTITRAAGVPLVINDHPEVIAGRVERESQIFRIIKNPISMLGDVIIETTEATEAVGRKE